MKKFVAFFMAAVLCMGISVTALAADSPTPSTGDGGSGEVVTPSTGDGEDEVDIYALYSGSNAKVVSGKGSVYPLDNTKEMFNLLSDATLTAWADLGEDLLNGVFDDSEERGIVADYAFGVENPDGGKMVISLGDGASDYAGNLALVYHYNGTDWERMSSYALVDADGQIAISFDSYSPIYVGITNLTLDDVLDGASISVLTTSSSSSTEETAPQTGNSMGLIIVLIGVCALGGAAVTRKFAVR